MFALWFVSLIYVIYVDNVRSSQEERVRDVAYKNLEKVCGLDWIDCELPEQQRLHDVFQWSNPGCYIYVRTRVFLKPSALAALRLNLPVAEDGMPYSANGVYAEIEELGRIRSEDNPSFVLVDLNTYQYVDPLTISEWLNMFD